jgi:hypothetical protein
MSEGFANSVIRRITLLRQGLIYKRHTGRLDCITIDALIAHHPALAIMVVTKLE